MFSQTVKYTMTRGGYCTFKTPEKYSAGHAIWLCSAHPAKPATEAAFTNPARVFSPYKKKWME